MNAPALSRQALQDYFELVQEMLERGLFVLQGAFSPLHFKNIVTVVLRLEEFEWVEKFIEGHAEEMPEADRVVAKTYSLGLLQCARQDYEGAESRFFEGFAAVRRCVLSPGYAGLFVAGLL
ncbi:MAG: hypothetical protein AAF570_25775 [Bacteroidota bacterium]